MDEDGDENGGNVEGMYDGLVDEMEAGHIVDDGSYLVSPLYPETFTAEQDWEEHGGIPLAVTTSQPSEHLMTFSDDEDDEDDDIYDPPTDFDPEQPETDLHVRPLNIPRKKPTLRRSHNFREIDTTGEETTTTAVLVDEETGEDPELRRFSNEIGARVVATRSNMIIE
ncbi:hypothetical protein SGCOL_000942 [Colletotrichum sp. CLE4]